MCEMLRTSFCLILLFVVLARSKDNLRVAFEWKEIDFKYENAEARWTAIENHEFRPDNVIPFGLEVYRSRMYVALPRWRNGVPSSLAYFDINGESDTKYKLKILYICCNHRSFW